MQVETLLSRLDGLVASGATFSAVLETAVKGVHQLNTRFDWTGIYELYPDNVLRLGPFVGSPTDHVFIGVGTGVCGTAVAEKRNMNIAAVRTIVTYRACVTEPRAELVILIRSGESIHAQIDIDSHQVGAFEDGVVAGVQKVADWLAERYQTRDAAA